MNYDRVIRQRSLKHFARYYRLILFSVVVAVMVIVGSLVIGDSVRATLRRQVEERLGNSQSVIFARQSLLEDEIMQHPMLKNAHSYMLVEGFLSYEGRMLPVMVWGTDQIEQVKINEPLMEELGGLPTEDIVLRLPATGMVPSGSLFVTENYTTSLRVNLSGVITAEQGGNMNLRNEQIRPLNIFIPRQMLGEAMEREGKINLILADDIISSEQWHDIWQSEHSGLKVSTTTAEQAVTSSRIFLQKQVVEAICRDNKGANRLYSYLANDIASKYDTIPYSFVTAMDHYKGVRLGKNDIILSDYSAQRLQAKVGDEIDVSYFIAEGLKNLSTKWQTLKVSAIVPIEELEADKGLSAEFPGLSDVERCTEWDSDLPIDMDRIEQEDEDYWYDYRQTPKAIIPYSLVEQDWASDYGTATAIRIEGDSVNLSSLTSEMFGIDILHPYDEAIFAANNGVDFAGLFLALGFFIVAAALMLMYAPLWEMYAERKGEFSTLSYMGYSASRIKRMLFREATPIVIVGCILGVCAGLAYTGAILWLLEGVWHGATHTAAFHIHIRTTTVLFGTLASIVLMLIVLAYAIRQATNILEPSRIAPTTKASQTKSVAWAIITSIAAVGVYLYGLIVGGSVLLFVLAGLLFMIAAIEWVDTWILRNR